MSFGKKLELNKRQTNDRENDIKYKIFEKLSENGFLRSMRQQMKEAIAQEFSTSKSSHPIDPNKEIDKSIDNEEEINKDWDSLTKVSSIAKWEKQMRYELEIDREIQTRDLERQRERLRIDTNVLNERDKCLRIELSARERKLRLQEQELKDSVEEVNQRLAQISAKEQMISEIVSERIKSEMKDEIERLKKKFTELETTKLSLNKREEKIKEVEHKLHEQAMCVKERIDNKRMNEIELAKNRKDLEIIKKENEVLKQRIDSMEDYQLTKFENKSLKTELNAIKETHKNKLLEFESQKEKFDQIVKTSDERIFTLRMDLRKCEQELLLLKQKHQGDIDDYTNRLEQTNNQLKQSKLVAQQLLLKNHMLSKEILSTQNESQKIMKCKQISHNCLTQIDGQKFGCYICDHNVKALEESSAEFLVSTQRQLINGPNGVNGLDLQLLNPQSMPLNKNEENSDLKNTNNKQNEVPVLSNYQKSSPITNAIQNTLNSCAKDKQNGSHLTHVEDRQTNIKSLEDSKLGENTMNFNKLIHKSDNSLAEDRDINDSIDW